MQTCDSGGFCFICSLSRATRLIHPSWVGSSNNFLAACWQDLVPLPPVEPCDLGWNYTTRGARQSAARLPVLGPAYLSYLSPRTLTDIGKGMERGSSMRHFLIISYLPALLIALQQSVRFYTSKLHGDCYVGCSGCLAPAGGTDQRDNPA